MSSGSLILVSLHQGLQTDWGLAASAGALGLLRLGCPFLNQPSLGYSFQEAMGSAEVVTSQLNSGANALVFADGRNSGGLGTELGELLPYNFPYSFFIYLFLFSPYCSPFWLIQNIISSLYTRRYWLVNEYSYSSFLDGFGVLSHMTSSLVLI